MKKILSYIFILTIFLGFFSPIHYASAQNSVPCQYMDRAGVYHPIGCTGVPSTQIPGNNIAQNVASKVNPIQWLIDGAADFFAYILYLLLSMVSLLLYIAGSLLDWVLKYTIIDLKKHLDGLDGIGIAWKVIKDLMNITFIFILVYKGIELIIGAGSRESIKKFIAGVILASLLINFSLFFTKILIDASNIITIGFYNAITSSTAQINVIGGVGTPAVNTLTGISAPFMKHFGVTSFWSNITFTNNTIRTDGSLNMLITPIMGMILFLIISFVFFAVSVMFAVRYIVIIILLMLSPIAYMGMALPQMEGYARDWWKALNSQLLFGPIYMIMTWVILILMESPNFVTQANWADIANGVQNTNASYEQGPMSLIFNFAVIIGLIIASLIISKKTSTSGSSYIDKATKMATAKAGSTLMGGTAWANRKVFGNIGRGIADNADLQDAAKNGKGLSGAWARTKLYTARAARDATYDIRNASIPTSMIGDAIEGTLGRTETGKKIGLNDMSAIKSIPLTASISEEAGFGAGGTKSVVDERKESAERVAKREAANTDELALAIAKRDILAGKNAAVGSPEYIAMEQALAKLSTKQTETLVASNKELLSSQNFANMISIKTLEAINKSDKLSDADKSNLINTRFSEINTAMAALKIPVASRSPAQIAAIAALPGKVKGLSDVEIELQNPGYFNSDPTSPTYHPGSQDFVSNIRSGRVDTIYQNKNGQFTSTQINDLRNTRRRPLLAALAMPRGTAAEITAANTAAETAVRGLSPKEIASLDVGTITTPGSLIHPAIMEAYNPGLLKRMAPEMAPNDIQIIRAAIENAGTTPGSSAHMTSLATWLTTTDGANFQ